MRKIHLELNDLTVESFSTLDTNGKAGTVHGNSETEGCTDGWGCVSEFSNCASCLPEMSPVQEVAHAA